MNYSRARNRRFSDKLLVGPAGVGESSLARAVARKLLNDEEILFNGADLKTPAAMVTRLRERKKLPARLKGFTPNSAHARCATSLKNGSAMRWPRIYSLETIPVADCKWMNRATVSLSVEQRLVAAVRPIAPPLLLCVHVISPCEHCSATSAHFFKQP